VFTVNLQVHTTVSFRDGSVLRIANSPAVLIPDKMHVK
jgi:hypothetical protein